LNGGEEDAYRILMGKPEGKRPLGRPNIGEMVWIGLIWLRVGTGGGNEPSGSIKCWDYFLSGCAIGSFSRRAQLHQ
jgi:hypothetical protein